MRSARLRTSMIVAAVWIAAGAAGAAELPRSFSTHNGRGIHLDGDRHHNRHLTDLHQSAR